ncbi:MULTISPECIES: TIGR02710 family CRISPR-associated CARF protein [unclassified Meiothermus]|uniref:TIGR02710 family CRISPR-associated CARF protein n=1 Tax=unclassified Meiothermus TaxID=370471 RepID=UPI000D7BC333|nr:MULTISPECIES: TIGR02710 family CRISPR-associated CARF protein [unclassified Meiothermus]PZA07279.1 TIGR02710 family CRISPR-associated protein [Meiothermus sp. Pnk-1]RYM38013.1 TIGR02710 family CRISPR-associated protein [Meiothermus sp. PNK-Is4]
MNRNKEHLRELWEKYKSLLGQSNPRVEPTPQAKEAQEVYKNQIWPLTKEGFVDKGAQDYAASFHTVGTTPEPVILSAKALNAEKVYLLHTADTEKQCRTIETELGWGIDRIKTVQVSRSDPEDIYKQVRQIVDDLSLSAALAFDPTGGTKAMVAGLAMFAFSLAEEGRTAHVYYVDNEEYDDQLRRPVAGTEFLKRLENPREVIPDWLYYRAKEAYSQGDFLRAKQNFNLAAERENKARSLEAVLSEAYESIDIAQFKLAKTRLEELLDLLQKHPYKQSPLAKYTDAIGAQKEGLEAIIQLTGALSSKERSTAPLAEPTKVAWTLAALDFMAGRRLKTGRIAEAVLLRYRALELFLQHRLALRGFDTAKPDFQQLCTALGISLEVLKEKYQNERKAAKAKPDDALEQRSAVDLSTAFFLLRALGDEPAKAINANKVLGLASARDVSVFAHGFELPTEANAENLSEVLTEFIRHGGLPEVRFEPIPLA